MDTEISKTMIGDFVNSWPVHFAIEGSEHGIAYVEDFEVKIKDTMPMGMPEGMLPKLARKHFNREGKEVEP